MYLPPLENCTSLLNRKRKRGKSSDFGVLKPRRIQDLKGSVDEDAVKSKLEDHFNAQRDITDNGRQKAELNQTLASINMYEDYRQQKKKKDRIKGWESFVMLLKVSFLELQLF